MDKIWSGMMFPKGMNEVERLRKEGRIREEIYLTETSLRELAEGKIIFDDDGAVIIYPPYFSLKKKPHFKLRKVI